MKQLLRKSLKLARLLCNSTYRKSIRYGVAATIEHETILKNVPTLSTVVDIGANRGQFGTLARRIWPRAAIHCFEPLYSCQQTLANIGKAHDLQIHAVAIASKNEMRDINVSKKDHSSSLLKIGRLQSQTFPGTEYDYTETVRCMPLDHLIDQGDIESQALLKIDVQGTEMDVIEGCYGILWLFDYILIETSTLQFYEGQALHFQIDERLKKAGFKKIDTKATAFDDDGWTQADHLYKRVKNADQLS